LLPPGAAVQDPFVAALRRIEFESSRVVKAQILLLKSSPLLPVRNAVKAAIERRHAQLRELCEGIGVRHARSAAEPQ